MEIVGHQDWSTTRRYAVSLGGVQEEAVSAIAWATTGA